MQIAFIVLIYLIMPTICSVIVLLGYLTTKDSRKIILYSALLAIVFGIAGYCFKNPATDPDLVRYLAILSTYRNKNLIDSFNTAYTNLYAVDILFWIIANFCKPQMLPAFACFIYYFISFYIIGDYKIISGIKKSYFVVYFVFTIAATNFGSIVNGIRWPLAFSMFTLAIYRDLYKNQRNIFTYFLYLTSFFMHFSVIGLIAVRLVMLIKNKKRVLIYSLGIVLLPQVLQILAEKIGEMQTPIGLINSVIYFITRGNMYFQWQDGGWADIVRNSTYYRLEKEYFIIISLLFLYMILYEYYRTNKNGLSLNKIKSIYIFMFTYMVLTLITFLIASHVYIRFITPAVPLVSLVFFDSFQQEGKKGTEMKIDIKKLPILIFVLGLTIVGIMLNFYFIRTMVNIRTFVENIFTFNIFNMFIE